jgi:hypothetical protein
MNNLNLDIKDNSETTTETTAETTHTHGASAPSGSPENIGNGGGVGKSKFDSEFRKGYARKYGLGPGWLTTSHDGRYDDGIELQLERETPNPDDVLAARSAPVSNKMTFGEAAQHLHSVLDMFPRLTANQVIEEITSDFDLEDGVREQLIERFAKVEVARDGFT